MKPPFYFRWWSYLQPVHFEHRQSDYNEQLDVVLEKGQWQLLTNNAIYSYGSRYDNFYKTFAQLDWTKIPGPETLVLGLGLGSIPYMLERSFKQNRAYTLVEIDDVVVELADKYVLDDLKSPNDVVRADAEVFIDVCESTYDLICLDIFQDAEIPPYFMSIDCLETLERLLNPGGLLLCNLLATSVELQKVANDFHKRSLAIFPKATLFNTGTNTILVSDKGKLQV